MESLDMAQVQAVDDFRFRIVRRVFEDFLDEILSNGRRLEDSGSEPNPPPRGENSSPKDRNSRTSKLGSLWSIESKDIGIPESVAL
jgi:hypothetical protein